MSVIHGAFGLRYLTLGIGVFILMSSPTIAQVSPDKTLGKEASVVKQVNAQRDRIQGGARRGKSLFHSFREFNVNKDKAIYFSNPVGIDKILTRVTGDNPSSIFGTLGVEGPADLFLLNPRGILFGPEARLDIKGSFYASTTDGQGFEKHNLFGAIAPEASELLSIGSDISFFQQALLQPGSIINQGQLATGRDLALVGHRLELEGGLRSGGDLTIQGLDTVKVRDSVAQPFQALSGGDLLVQGNEAVDIFALNHPESGFVSGGDMVLRSSNAVIGDARYLSGGNFRVEGLETGLGRLVSIEDPVIRSLGDISFNAYFGTSLHVLSAGKIEIPQGIQITGPDPVNGIQETIQLSNGNLLPINGKVEPTLDLRAGVEPSVVLQNFYDPANFAPFENNFIFNPSQLNLPSFSSSVSTADINVGPVRFVDGLNTPLAGTVFLSNNYEPNPSLNGDISIFTPIPQAIQTGSVARSGDITIESQGSINLNGILSTAPVEINDSILSDGGNITLLAADDISLGSNSIVNAQGVAGGKISLVSGNHIKATSSFIRNTSFGHTPNLKSGDIQIQARLLDFDSSQVATGTYGEINAGNIILDIEENASFLNGSQLRSDTFGTGNAGDISIESSGSISFDGVRVANGQPIISGAATAVNFSENPLTQNISIGNGNAGSINVSSKSLSITNGAALSSEVFTQGIAGTVDIDTSDSVRLKGSQTVEFIDRRSGEPTSAEFLPFVRSGVNFGANGSSNDIQISTNSLTLRDGAKVSTETVGNQSFKSIETGDLNISISDQLGLYNGAQFRTDTFGVANAGNVTITAPEAGIIFDGIKIINGEREVSGISSSANFLINPVTGEKISGSGNAGDINITSKSLIVSNGAAISSASTSEGDAGNIFLDSADSITLYGNPVTQDSNPLENETAPLIFPVITSGVDFGGTGEGGDIEVNTGILTLKDKSQVVTATSGGVSSLNRSNAGNIFLNIAHLLNVESGAQLRSDTFGYGDGGDIAVNAPTANLIIDGAEIVDNKSVRTGLSSTVGVRTEPKTKQELRGIGNAGTINILSKNFLLTNGAGLSSGSFSEGDSGDIFLEAQSVALEKSKALNFINSSGNVSSVEFSPVISSDVGFGAVGQGGKITISSKSFILSDGSQVSSATSGKAGLLGPSNAGDILVMVDERLNLSGGSQFRSDTLGQGKAGDITIKASNAMVEIDGADVFQNRIRRSGLLSIVGIDSALESTLVGEGDGGNIKLKAKNLTILDGGTLTADTFGNGKTGDILIEVQDSTTLAGSSTVENVTGIGIDEFLDVASSISSSVQPNAVGQGGTVDILTSSLLLMDGAEISTATGGVEHVNGTRSDAGPITITVDDYMSLQSGAQLRSDTFNQGDAGNIIINAESANLKFDGSEIINSQVSPSGVSSAVNLLFGGMNDQILSRGVGNAGNITIKSSSFSLTNGAALNSTTLSEGNAGDITIHVAGLIELEGQVTNISSSVGFKAKGMGGDVDIIANALTLNDGAIIGTSTSGDVGLERADAGNITVQINEKVSLARGSQLRTDTFGQGDAGNIIVSAPNADVRIDGVEVVDNLVRKSGFLSFVGANPQLQLIGTGKGGDIIVKSKSLAINNGATLNSATFGRGNAGDIFIEAPDSTSLQGTRTIELINPQTNNPVSFTITSDISSNVNLMAVGKGGSIDISTDKLLLRNGAQIGTATSGLESEKVRADAGDIKMTVNEQLHLLSGAQFRTDTFGQGSAGNIIVNAPNGEIKIDGSNSINNEVRNSGMFSFVGVIPQIQQTESRQGGDIAIKAGFLMLDNGAQINNASFGFGDSGSIEIDTHSIIKLEGRSLISSSIFAGGQGNAGKIDINASSLNLLDGSQVQSALVREFDDLSGGVGDGGSIFIKADESVMLSGYNSDGSSSGLLVLSERGASGSPGSIEVTTRDFQVDNGAIVAAGIFNDGAKRGGNITINARNFNALDGGQILTNTRSSSKAGSINLNIRDSILVEGRDGNFENRESTVKQQLQLLDSSDFVEDIIINEGPKSGLFANTSPSSSGDGGDISIDPITVTLQNGGVIAVDSKGSGKGGDIELETDFLFLNNQAEIRANSSQAGDAGSITLQINESLTSSDSDITTSAARASGGEIRVNAGDIRLRGDSDILTNVATGRNTGGNISLTADSIIAFDDSDIIASSQDGTGGNISLNTPVFFGSRFQAPVQGDPDGNNRVDIDASGAISNGSIQIPDVSFVQNNLSELPENIINPEILVANSCVVRSAKQTGTFTITGSGGLPAQPNGLSSASYSTSKIRSISQPKESKNSESKQQWNSGEAIVEPQQAFRLSNGQFILSRACL